MKRPGLVFLVVLLIILVVPLAADAQPAGKPVRLGLLYGGSSAFNPDSDPFDKAFVQGLRENATWSARTS